MNATHQVDMYARPSWEEEKIQYNVICVA